MIAIFEFLKIREPLLVSVLYWNHIGALWNLLKPERNIHSAYVGPYVFFAKLHLIHTDLNTWMAGNAEKLRQSGRHIGPVKKPS